VVQRLIHNTLAPLMLEPARWPQVKAAGEAAAGVAVDALATPAAAWNTLKPLLDALPVKLVLHAP
jgi:fatty-acyl-CoA synthase